VAGFQACEDIYSDPEDEVNGPVEREEDASKLTLTDVEVEQEKGCLGKCFAKCGSMFQSFKDKTGCCQTRKKKMNAFGRFALRVQRRNIARVNRMYNKKH